MKKGLFLIFFFIVTACSSNNVEEINSLDPIEVKLEMSTELSLNEEMTTQAIVTQKGKPISDASEVGFEIWQHGEPDTYRFVDGMNKGKGVYEVTWTAEEEGVYYIFYHVTARGMHRMEKHQFIIGDVDVDKILATPDERPEMQMN